MTHGKNVNNASEILYLNVTDNLSVDVVTHKDYEYLISTKDVALGYGVKEPNIRKHRWNYEKEFIEGKHFVKAVTISNSVISKSQPTKIYWTKAGVIRLGFFIKSERAKQFRDWAERLILKIDEQKDLFGNSVTAAAKPKTLHNRLTHERIIDIMQDICEIEDKELRMRIASKLTKGGAL